VSAVGPPSRRSLTLSEYEERQVELTHVELQRLRAAAGDRVRFAPGDGRDRWIIRATQHVGTIVTEDVQLLVRPKVPVANLLHLLEADGRALEVGRGSFDYGVDPELVPAFATLYARRLEEALSSGVVRAYVTEEDRLLVPRGRIDIARQARTGWSALPVACRFDEYAVDTPLNRILLAAARRLMRMAGVAPSTRRALARAVDRLDGVGPLQRSDLERPTRFTRLDERFRATEALARLVLASASVRDDRGTVAASSFLLDMNVVFERFVSHRLARCMRAPLRVDLQHPLALDDDRHVQMRPDIILRDGPQVVAVADAKYKITSDGLGRSTDYYQLLAYVTALALPAGLLIYCQADGDVPPRRVSVRHTGQVLESHALRLDGSIRAIEDGIEELAERLRSLGVRQTRVMQAA
jgi:5-methylcytosine-specific restriction enzyme subunit McrC